MKKILTGVLVPILFVMMTVQAVANEATGDAVPFSIQAVLPDNQVGDVTYFNLEVEAGQEQTIEVTLFNNSSEPVTLELALHSANTNANGILIYDGSNEQYHANHDIALEAIGQLSDDKITLEPASQQVVSITLEIPKEGFAGDVLGGLYVRMIGEEVEDTEQAIGIVNEYVNELAIQLQEADRSDSIMPDIELVDIDPGIYNYRTGLNVHLANPEPLLMTGYTVEGRVYEVGNEEVLYSREVEGFDIAPYAVFNFPISFENEPLEPGEYVFRGSAVSEEETFEFEQPFSISEEVAEQANEEAVELVESNDWLIYVVVGLAVIILILVGIIIKQRQTR